MLRAEVRPVLAALCVTALAQDAEMGFSAHGFTLVAQDADPRDGLVLERPGSLRAGQIFAGALLEYARAPLVLDDGTDRTALLDHVSALHLVGGAALHERLRLDVGLPVFLASTGTSGGQGPVAGDVRLAAMAVLIPARDSGFGLGVVPWLTFPSGDADRYLGAPGLSGGGVVAASFEARRAGLTANAGVGLAPEISARNLSNADHLIAGLGGHVMLGEATGLHAEVRGRVPFLPAGVPGTETPFEAVGSVRHVPELDRGGFLTAGLAGALTPGAGAATFRVFVGGGFGVPVAVVARDTDGDGFPDRQDGCPRAAETDNDFEDDDGCPDELPTLSVRVLHDGQPVAGALGDVGGAPFTSTEHAMAVPVEPGTIAASASWGPCLSASAELDVQQDAVLDLELTPRRDAAVQVSVRTPGGDPVPGASVELRADAPGCAPTPVWLAEGAGRAELAPTLWRVRAAAEGHSPWEGEVRTSAGETTPLQITLTPTVTYTRVRIDASRIELLEQVHFDTGKATLRPESTALLDEVRSALEATAGRGRVEVQGHTDDKGSDAANLKLSQDRADAVVAWLVARGIPASRLTAKGYGESQPEVPNADAATRQQNRRVEFVFVEVHDPCIRTVVPRSVPGHGVVPRDRVPVQRAGGRAGRAVRGLRRAVRHRAHRFGPQARARSPAGDRGHRPRLRRPVPRRLGRGFRLLGLGLRGLRFPGLRVPRFPR